MTQLSGNCTPRKTSNITCHSCPREQFQEIGTEASSNVLRDIAQSKEIVQLFKILLEIYLKLVPVDANSLNNKVLGSSTLNSDSSLFELTKKISTAPYYLTNFEQKNMNLSFMEEISRKTL